MAQPEIIKDIDARVKDTGDTMTGNLTAPTFIGSLQGNASSSTYSTYTCFQDTRNVNEMPLDMLSGISLHLKSNSIDGLSDGLSHHLVLMLRDWYDLSGGSFAELTITGNQNLCFRSSTTNADNTWNPWRKVLTDYNYTSILNNTYLPLSGGTMTGPLNFANNIWNKVGDDVQIGDANVAGTLCIQGLNGTTALEFRKYNDLANFGRLSYDGNNFIFERNIYIQHATPNFNIYDTTTKRLFQLYTDDNENNLILNWKSAGNFTQLALLAEKYGANDIAHLYRYVNNVAEEYNILHSGNFSNYAAKGTGYFTGGDFNTITTSGMYRFNDNASYTNAPSLSWGQMLVIHGAGDTIVQMAFNYAARDGYIRMGNPPDVGGSGSWTSWGRIWLEGNSVTGAVWNDYAECREADTIEPGYVLVETGDDSLTKSTKRLSPFAGVSSDTWGFSQGETDKAKTPIAVAGRVLVYPWQDRNNYKPGDCVCTAPEGKVDIMTREEIIQYPDRIVGTVSSVPTYDKWGGGENADREPVDVNGRIWIKVR